MAYKQQHAKKLIIYNIYEQEGMYLPGPLKFSSYDPLHAYCYICMDMCNLRLQIARWQQ